MKNKIALATAALVAGSSLATAEIVVNDFLSFEGFVDMSYTHLDEDIDASGYGGSDNSFQIDQVEISWLFDFDPVTAQIDLQYEDLPNGGSYDISEDEFSDGNVVEQAFATYDLGNGGAITAGRYASMIGFEAFEPTGLYQYSFAYDAQMLDLGDITIIPGYAQGVKYTYETDTTFFGLSIQDEVFDYDGDRLGGTDASGFGVEAAYSMTFENGLGWFLGGAYEEADEAEGDSYMVNTYVTYETGAWVFAAEVNYGESEAGAFALSGAASDLGFGVSSEEEEALQALIMANFAYSESASVTGRISYVDHELGDVELDGVKFTLAHGYAFTDNLFLVNEISFADGELDSGSSSYDGDSLLFATELIFSF